MSEQDLSATKEFLEANSFDETYVAVLSKRKVTEGYKHIIGPYLWTLSITKRRADGSIYGTDTEILTQLAEEIVAGLTTSEKR